MIGVNEADDNAQFPGSKNIKGRWPGTLAPIGESPALWSDWTAAVMRSESAATEFRSAVADLKGYIRQVLRPTEHSTQDETPCNVHMTLLRLREYNRNMSLGLKSKKKRVQFFKNALDRTELSRQNIMYEKEHIEATIEDTRRHESLHLSIPLAEEDEQKGEERTGSVDSDNDEHQKMLSRLGRELDERRRLSDALKASQENLELAKSRLVLKKKELEKVRDQLDGIIRSTEPFISSHSRLFVEIQKQQAQLDEASVEMSDGVAPLEKLSELLLSHADTHHTKVQVCVFEGLEAGKELAYVDGDDYRHGQNHSRANGSGDGDEDEDGSVSISFESLPKEKHAHSRFATHSNSRNRRFSFHYLRVDLCESSIPSCYLYFYHVVPEDLDSPIVVRIEIPERDLGKGEAEALLLTLDLETSFLLTVPHELVVPGESGHVPFLWLQAVSGLLHEDSFADSNFIIDRFYSAVQTKVGTQSVDSDVNGRHTENG